MPKDDVVSTLALQAERAYSDAQSSTIFTKSIALFSSRKGRKGQLDLLHAPSCVVHRALAARKHVSYSCLQYQSTGAPLTTQSLCQC